MNQEQKLLSLKTMLSGENISDAELNTLLLITKGAILNRRFPFGSPMVEDVPLKYETLQLQMCVSLYNKKGVEGQTSHSENGIVRNYEEGDIPKSLLKQIVPLCSSVTLNEGANK